MIVREVYKIKKGIVVVIDEPECIPNKGDILHCGEDSWNVIGVEKPRSGCFGPPIHTDRHHVLLSSTDGKGKLAEGAILVRR